MEKKWFVFSDQVVRGPLTTENIEEGLSSGRWTLDTLIWWKGQSQWITISNWRVHLPELALKEDKVREQEWYVESKGKQTGPMTRAELINFLKDAKNPFQYSLWTPGLDQWKKLYFYEEILNELGKNRRALPRAPLSGAVEVQKHEHRFTLQTSSIGPGGLGLLRAQPLVAGQVVQLTIRSPAFPIPIRSNGHILYVANDGGAGVKFENIHIEAKSTIIDYVKQFDGKTEGEVVPLPKKKDPSAA